MKIEDVIIIGAGPAGIAAAIQLRRQGIDPIVFEKGMIGGLLRNANLVENYPGFPGGIPGDDLVELFQKQLEEHAIRMRSEEVTLLDFKDDHYVVETTEGRYNSRIALIASGTKPRPFEDVEITGDIRPLVHYEIYPILQEKGKRIVIVGAGDAAFDYALNLQRHNKIVILNRGETVRCLPLLWERAAGSDSISYHTNTAISDIRQDSDGSLRIDCMAGNEAVSFEADCLVFAIGRDPQLDFVSDEIRMNLDKFEERGNLYCLGDVKSGMFRQTAIAVGDSILAAMKIYRTMMEEHK